MLGEALSMLEADRAAQHFLKWARFFIESYFYYLSPRLTVSDAIKYL